MIDGVFVYGTLLRGEERGAVIRELAPTAILMAEAAGTLWDLGAYPGLALEPSHGLVQGELVKFEDIGRALEVLDEIEGFIAPGAPDNLYERLAIEVGMGDGRVRTAWTYVYAGPLDQAAPITSGDWRASRGRRERFISALVAAHIEGRDLGQIASRLERRQWFDDKPIGGREALEQMIRDGTLSERQLAQVTDRWAVQPWPEQG
ncbi:MAG: gamma-glutamylcyclotransferase [Deltaproteobacteria bacterium]|nr:gamma-glutamylcyclotransferase [Deltaproteobacteria bacterium]